MLRPVTVEVEEQPVTVEVEEQPTAVEVEEEAADSGGGDGREWMRRRQETFLKILEANSGEI